MRVSLLLGIQLDDEVFLDRQINVIARGDGHDLANHAVGVVIQPLRCRTGSVGFDVGLDLVETLAGVLECNNHARLDQEAGDVDFAASHSNCRALCPHTRNLTDAMIRALAEKGGIAGLNYYAAFLDTDPAHPEACRSTVERIAEHAAHYKQVGGIGVLALGSDFDGIDGHHQLETAADMPLLADALRRAGFTEDEVERIFWRNARDFFKHNL